MKEYKIRPVGKVWEVVAVRKDGDHDVLSVFVSKDRAESLLQRLRESGLASGYRVVEATTATKDKEL